MNRVCSCIELGFTLRIPSLAEDALGNRNSRILRYNHARADDG